LVSFAADDNHDAVTLARAGKGYVVAPAIAAFRALTSGQVEELKKELRAFLEMMAGGEATDSRIATRVTVTIMPVETGASVSLLVDGPVRDVLLYQVSTLLNKVGVDRLRLCPAPDCRRPFIKIGRREYCSDRCQRRVFLSGYDPLAARRLAAIDARRNRLLD